ncbi:MAG: serine/threonine-protein phosphatase [Spirochaetales bacterium]|nr:serine/threonine-protein phosphatase [Spirochaetales bacterium]
MKRSLWQRVLLLFQSPDRRALKAEFKEDLHNQAYVIHWPGGLLATVAWLGFALDTDRRLHPEFPELIYFRLGLTALGLLLTVSCLFDLLRGKNVLRGRGLGWMYVLVGYTIFSVSYFTGRIADDPNYVSGMQIAVLLIIFLPFPRRITYSMIGLSILIFVSSLSYWQPDLSSFQAQYSMQNLAIAYGLAMVMGFILDRYRFSIFSNHNQVLLKSSQLQEQIHTVNKLKEQQDGDYFLTANLIKPLIRNNVQESPVSIEFYLDQHKKFHFRHWSSQIGGDYLYADRILLADGPSICFINGDAMGKSIQGAGGALVLGTVFRSLVTRTQMQADLPYPEQWLKNAFIELQNVFVTFDGLMLISAIIGLLHEKSGLLYYINAEHPRPVLWRDNRAVFLQEKTLFRKIGILSADEHIAIDTLLLQRDDVVLLGSDGRDDLDLGRGSEGKRQINEEEELFLESVYGTRADLSDLVKELRRQGELIDDLSLMRIGYKEDAPAQNDGGQIRETLERELVQARQAKDWSGALDRACRLSELYPDQEAYLLTVLRLARREYVARRLPEKLKLAIDFGERLRLRNRRNAAALLYLADSYRMQGQQERSQKILKEAQDAGADEQAVQRVRSLLS